MSHAVDLAQLTRKAPARESAGNQDRNATRVQRDDEPSKKERFDKVLDRESRRTEQSPKTDQAEGPAKPKKSEKAESKQAEPVDEAEQVEADESVGADEPEPAGEPAPIELSVESELPLADDDADADAPQAATADEQAPDVAPTIVARAPASEQEKVASSDAPVDGASEAPRQQGRSQSRPIQPANLGQPEPAAEADEQNASGALQLPPGMEAATDADELPGAVAANALNKSEATPSPLNEQAKPLQVEIAVDDKVKLVQAPAPLKPVATPVVPEQQFQQDNVDKIVTGVKTNLLPNGGTMKIRLDPPNLGQLQIDVTVDDGVVNAAFNTTSDEATRLLSHSLQHLKTALESAGVSVDRIQVKQTSSSDSSSNQQSGEQDRQQNAQDHPQRQEQQRREALQRMWRKLALGDEPLDLVA